MAWKFPRHRIDSNNPTATDPVNENFNEISHESGKLNEHNFESNAVSSVGDMAAKAAFVVKQSLQEVNHGLIDGLGGAGAAPNNTTGGVSNDIIGTTNSWTTIANLSATVQTEDSILWILSSFQRLNGSDSAFAISVDGYVLPETILGGVTRDNDPYGFGSSHSNEPFALDAIVPIAAGSHTVEVVARFFRRASFAATSGLMDTIQNRELIVIELRR